MAERTYTIADQLEAALQERNREHPLPVAQLEAELAMARAGIRGPLRCDPEACGGKRIDDDPDLPPRCLSCGKLK